MPLSPPEDADDTREEINPTPDAATDQYADESLPAPAARDQARLLVQSPELLFLYWDFARDPREALRLAFGDDAPRYVLAVRLVDTETGRERLHGAGAAQTIWLEARPGRSYRAEVGFHLAGRAFVRLLSSDVARTPSDVVSAVTADAPPPGTALLDLTGMGDAGLTDAAYGPAVLDAASPPTTHPVHGAEDLDLTPSSHVWGLWPPS